jgi:hypothetical protein
MPERLAYVRLNEAALRHLPADAAYTINGVPGAGLVTLTARDPVLVDKEGKCLGVPVDFIASIKLHKEMVIPRDADGAGIDRIARFLIAPKPFAVPQRAAPTNDNIFNTTGDAEADALDVFNTAGEVSPEETAEEPAADAKPSAKASGAKPPKRGGTSTPADPTALP